MDIKKEFIEKVNEELKRSKDNNVPFLLVGLEQVVESECFKSVLDEINEYWYEVNYCEPENTDYYLDEGKLEIFISKNKKVYTVDEFDDSIDYKNYRYVINITSEERMWGYCQCSKEDEGYDERHKCCGNKGCDHIVPHFEIQKIKSLGTVSFNGTEKDIWNYEDTYYNVDTEKAKREERVKNINEEIKRLQNELRELA